MYRVAGTVFRFSDCLYKSSLLFRKTLVIAFSLDLYTRGSRYWAASRPANNILFMVHVVIGKPYWPSLKEAPVSLLRPLITNFSKLHPKFSLEF